MEDEPLHNIESIVQNGVDIATANYKTTIDGYLRSPVMVTYATPAITQNKKPGVVKIPQQFIQQLATLPIECFGIPIELLIRLSHHIINSENKSVIQTPEKKLVLPD